MPRGPVLSAILHVAILAIAFFGLPRFFDRTPPDKERMIVVEIVDIAEETNLPQAVPRPPEPEPPEPKAKPEPEPMVEPEPPPIAALEPPPPPKEEEIPVVEEPAPKPEPRPAAKPPASPPPKKAQRVPKPKPKPKPRDQFASLLKSVEKIDKELTRREIDKETAPPKQLPALTGTASPQLADEALSLSVIDAIARQVEANWSVPVGAREARNLQVAIRIRLQPDGSVIQAEFVDRARLTRPGEEFYRTVAESARRAVLKASPLRGLPPEKYRIWRDIVFTFRPPA